MENNERYDNLLKEWHHLLGKKPVVNDALFNHITFGDKAYKTLYEHAASSQVLMFNESHFVPKHRYFVSSLLDTLYHLGYRYLALEALDHKDGAINRRTFPLLKTGFYFREPQLANLVRRALKIGYQIIPYEDTSSVREYQQAKNLYKNVIVKDKNAKVLVLAGFDHINETTPKGGTKRMAEFFKEISGINPLTINQVEYDYSSKKLRQRKIGVIDKEALTKLGLNNLHNDLYVINNFQDAEVYPFTVENSGNFKIDISKLLFGNGGAVAILYKNNEYEINGNSIPLSVRFLPNNPKNGKAKFIHYHLPDGNYLALIKDSYSNILYSKEFLIK